MQAGEVLNYIDDFLTFEKENNLFDITIREFKYWHYIRFSLYSEIIRQKENLGQAHTNLKKEKYSKRVFLKFKQIPNFLLKNPIYFLRKKELLILNHSRRVKNGDYYDCLYTDLLIKNLKSSYYVFEKPILEKHFFPIRTQSIRYLDYINFRGAIYKELMKRIVRFSFSRSEEVLLCNLIDKINFRFKVGINKINFIHMIEDLYLSYKSSSKFYKKILNKVKPKAIIEVVSYDFEKYLVNELAKDMGIPIIELQHGTMGKYHIGYNFVEKMMLSTLPDYIFVFGQFWKDTTRLPIDDSNVKVVGWPYYENKVDSRMSVKGDKKVILFISQGPIGKELSNLAVNLSRKINLERYKIIYKLHPGEYDRWKKEYPWLLGEQNNIEIIENNEYDMHHYFSRADIQVGVSSTALFEGLGYGLLTYIYKVYSYEYMEELFRKKIVNLVETDDQILLDLESRTNQHLNYDVSYFWERNSMSKIISQIDYVLNKGLEKE